MRLDRIVLGLLWTLILAPFALAQSLSTLEGWALVGKAEQGDASAVQKLIQLYQQGDPEAAVALGVLHLNGIVYTRDFDRAREYFEWARKQGSGWGSWGLAFLYGNGLGVPRDFDRYIALIKEGMQRGYSGAKAAYARALIDGMGVPRDGGQGVALLKQVEGNRDPIVLTVLASYLGFRDLPGMPKDPSKARSLLEEASSYGYSVARGFLSYFLFFGVGGEPDQKRALAVAQPLVGFNLDATGVWATALYFGQGGAPKDPGRACQLVAGEKLLVASSRTILGLCLLEGRIQGGRPLGMAHLAKAASAGHSLAKSLLSEWMKRLSKEELEEAKRLLKDLP